MFNPKNIRFDVSDIIPRVKGRLRNIFAGLVSSSEYPEAKPPAFFHSPVKAPFRAQRKAKLHSRSGSAAVRPAEPQSDAATRQHQHNGAETDRQANGQDSRIADFSTLAGISLHFVPHAEAQSDKIARETADTALKSRIETKNCGGFCLTFWRI